MAGQRPGDTLPVSHRSARPAAVSASHAGLAPNLALPVPQIFRLDL